MQRYVESRSSERGRGEFPTFLFHSRELIQNVSCTVAGERQSRGCAW